MNNYKRIAFDVLIFVTGGLVLGYVGYMVSRSATTPVVFEYCSPVSGCKTQAQFKNLEDCERYHSMTLWACDKTMSPPSDRKNSGSVGTFTCELISEEWDRSNLGTGLGHCR